jgi:glycosyltransferase involved in cell wall biosynthesis
MKFLERGMKMLIISSYSPRECGLATFSNDILNAIKQVFGSSIPIEVCALQNDEYRLQYGKEVTYILSAHSFDDYRWVAEEINGRNDIGLVCVQHEFGLFGGDYGDHLLSFLLALNKPIVTVFHTVLPNPVEDRKNVVQAIANLSDRIVVLTKKSEDILVGHYGFQRSKIKVIPHGTHIVLWEQKEKLKAQLHFKDKIVMTTFGLISENKSIETVLYALPEVVKQHPEVIYLVLGKTHPEIIKREGEKYRNMLLEIVSDLGITDHVIFINEYLGLKQLLNYLTLSDIYLFTTKDPHQAVSGTFSYAMSCGCAVISTPIPHALESLDSGTGLLLDGFGNPEAFKKAILTLIENKEERIVMGKNAYCQTHTSTWENVAIQYGLLFGELTNRSEDLRFCLPPINTDHIKKLTTDFGILQFSRFSQPDPDSGYTLDDNARALINLIMYYEIYKDDNALKLANTYLSFIESMQRESGWFDNYKSYHRQLTTQNSAVNLEDSNGRALWSLGYTISHRHVLPQEMVLRAENCWRKAINGLTHVTSPRAISYIIKGLYHFYSVYKEDTIRESANRFADQLLYHYNFNSGHKWHWYEDYMTYANTVMPEAMMYSHLITGNELYKKIAILTFDFLLSHYFMKGQLKVISNRGWFKKENDRVFYGEQPIEVATTIIALDLFYEITGNEKYKDQLELAFSWFLGNNHLRQIMYNPVNGASYDGLEDTQVNINQGAESTLCFFKARIIMEKYVVEGTFNKSDNNLLSGQLINFEKIQKTKNNEFAFANQAFTSKSRKFTKNN